MPVCTRASNLSRQAAQMADNNSDAPPLPDNNGDAPPLPNTHTSGAVPPSPPRSSTDQPNPADDPGASTPNSDDQTPVDTPEGGSANGAANRKEGNGSGTQDGKDNDVVQDKQDEETPFGHVVGTDLDPADPHNLPDIIATKALSKETTLDEDDFFKDYEVAVLGSAIFIVNELNQEWRDELKLPFKNRDLNHKHVRNLQRSLKIKAHRADPQHNMRCSMTKKEFFAHVDYTCLRQQALKDMPLNPFGIKEVDTRFTLVTKLKKNYQSPAVFRDAPIIYCNPSVRLPQLDAGQHRKAALLKNASFEYKQSDASPTTAMHLGWVCQIIDLDVVEASGKAQLYYQRIRVNQIDIYEHDSESGVFLQIDSIWEKWLQVDKAASQEAKNQSRKLGPKHERFGTFVHEELGTAIEDTTRLVTLFEDDYWRSMARQYNGYTFGRQLFKTYHFTQAKGQCLDEFWSGHMGTMFNTMELIFGASAKKVRVNDLLLMSKIGILGSDDPVTKDNLRKCFFPDFDDTKGGLLGVMQEWNENLGLIQQMRLSDKPNIPVHHRGHSRRPYFLEALTGEEYCQVYDTCVGLKIAVSPPTNLAQVIRDNGDLVKDLARYAVYFADSTLRMPHRTQARANLVHLLHEAYVADPSESLVTPTRKGRPSGSGFIVDEDEDDGDSTFETLFDFFGVVSRKTVLALQDQKTKKTVEQHIQRYDHVLNFLCALQQMVKNTKSSWATPKKSGLFPLHEDRYVNVEVDQATRREFRNMFNFQPWSTFLSLVIRHFKVDRFVGMMTPWIKDPKRHTRSNLTNMFHSAYQFYGPQLLSRMKGLPVNVSMQHSHRIAAGINDVIHSEELRTWEKLRLGIATIEAAQGQDNKKTSRPRTLTDWQDKWTPHSAASKDPDRDTALACAVQLGGLTKLQELVDARRRLVSQNLQAHGYMVDLAWTPDETLTFLGGAPSHDAAMSKVSEDGVEEESDYAAAIVRKNTPRKRSANKKRANPRDHDASVTPSHKRRKGPPSSRRGRRSDDEDED